MSGNGVRNACVPLFAREIVKSLTAAGAVGDPPQPIAASNAALTARVTVVRDVRMVPLSWMTARWCDRAFIQAGNQAETCHPAFPPRLVRGGPSARHVDAAENPAEMSR